MDAVVAVTLFSVVLSGTGLKEGDREAGSTVPLDSGMRTKSSMVLESPSTEMSFDEPKRGCDRVRGDG